MVIAETNNPEEIRAGDYGPPRYLNDTDEFFNKIFRLLNMFKHIKCADGGEVPAGEWQVFAVIYLTGTTELLRAGNIGFRHVHAASLITSPGQILDDLPHTASDIEYPDARPADTKRISIFVVKMRALIRKELCVSFIMTICLLVAHRRLDGSEGQVAVIIKTEQVLITVLH